VNPNPSNGAFPPPKRFSGAVVLGREPETPVWLALDEERGQQVQLRLWPAGTESAQVLKRLTSLSSPFLPPPLDQLATLDGVWVSHAHHASCVSLETWLTREHYLPFLEAVRLLSEIASVMEAAEIEGLRHGSLQPAVVLWRNSHTLLMDLGLCQAKGIEVTAAHDLVAFGVLAHRVLTGQIPEENQANAPSRLREHLPPGLSRAVVRCLCINRTATPVTWHELSILLSNLVTPAQGYTIQHLRDQADWLRRQGQEKQASVLEQEAEKRANERLQSEQARITGSPERHN